MSACVFTIISKNYLSHARVLMKSCAEHHPTVRRIVVLADKNEGYFDALSEDFEVIEVGELGIRDFASFAFKYNIVELNTAVKPFSFVYLFDRHPFEQVLYLDPDIRIFRPLTEVFDALASNAIVVTPHILTPLPDDGRIPREVDILKGGIFNLGFIGIARGGGSQRLLSWWKERLYDKCLQAPLTGYAVDQGWLSLAPCFFSDCFILREPGYNVAYWNLHERTVTREEDGFAVNGSPLVFFHFSGFNPGDIERISKYQNRFALRDMQGLRGLFELYWDLLREEGYPESSQWPYSYGYSKKGRRISELTRGIYWGLGADSEAFGDPFDGFWPRLLRMRFLRGFFRGRMVRALSDKLLMYLWKNFSSRKR
ncbi:MAG: hypothetical protein M0Z71_08015 [Nitrospiraceae bacterium]|nr:hypothetical protein [Nitrospiraceae bacterium]